MAKPNYAFEKRQRELAKKKKQEAKEARKREAREAIQQNAQPDPEPAPAPSQDRHAPDPAAGSPPSAPGEEARGARVHRRPAAS